MTHRLHDAGVLAFAVCIALLSALPYAGGWNDGSRLATVESLVDYHTLSIDRSIFVAVPQDRHPAPYPADDAGLLENGTGDKLLINGHYYSDKSPVPALLLAVVYKAMQSFTGLTARERPDVFCYWMTVLSSGLAYVVSVWCIYRLGSILRLEIGLRLALTASFGLATVALPYARHVNNHMLLLGVSSLLVLQFAAWAETGVAPWRRLLAIGFLSGLGYAIDLGAGPVLILCVLGLVYYRAGTLTAVGVVVLAAAPCIVLHHAVNYAVGGTFKPANAVAEYFNWPGCTFDTENMTGLWTHPSFGGFLLYAGDLLVGKNGFLGHNLPLFLALSGMVLFLCRRGEELPEILFLCCWCGGTWLLYAMTSTNHSGQCCSVRWFVPLLAPGYYALALLLRIFPIYFRDFMALSAWGLVFGALMWRHGPWMKHMVPLYWALYAGALLTWLYCRVSQPISKEDRAAAEVEMRAAA